MGNKKKKNVVLDLSIPAKIELTTEFEVGDYDYESRQGNQVTGFDEDLQFLLSESSQVSGESSSGKVDETSRKLRSEAPSSISKKSHEKLLIKNKTSASKPKKSKLETSEKKSKSKLETKAQNPPKSTHSKSAKSAAKSNRITRKEITRDLDGIDFSTDEEGPVILKEGESFKFNFDLGEEDAKTKTAAKRKSKKNKGDAFGTNPKASSAATDFLEEATISDTVPEAAPKSSKKSAKKAAKAQKKAQIEALASKNLKDSTEADSTPESPISSAIAESESRNSVPPSPVTTAGSHTSMGSEFSRLSASKTPLKQLPAVQPVSTIFGLTHDQIYKTKLTDVKVKLIVSVPMSKMCKNALTFVMAENEGLFRDDKKRSQFVDLCVNVALWEAPGFNEVTKRIPQMLEWVPTYGPLTLDHTQTNVTLSQKNMHKNNLDYTVFSFFGHILLWANELQYAEKMPTLIEEYALQISRQDVLKSVGGYHLWDRLRRDKTINAKRWKHIQKYRSMFAFEEHQFVLILRCMNLGVPVC